MNSKKTRNLLIKYALLLLGSAIAAVGLEIFLVPNNIIDGGIVGISIISSHLTRLPLGLFTFTLNVPFFDTGIPPYWQELCDFFTVFNICIFNLYFLTPSHIGAYRRCFARYCFWRHYLRRRRRFYFAERGLPGWI